MALLQNLREPLVVIALFTITALINRRSRRKSTDSTSAEKLPLYNSKARNGQYLDAILSLFSRFLSAFPFLMEIWYWNLTYWVYQLGRAYSAQLIYANENTMSTSKQHAMQIMAFEKYLHIDVERRFQQYILNSQSWSMVIFEKIYYAHIVVGVVFIAYMYTFVPASTFQRIRRTIAMDNAIAFVIFTVWRCMPPRFMDGYEDVLHHRTHSAWARNRFQLTIAAMPSLHFGTSAFLSWCIWRFAQHRSLRLIAPFYPVAMFATILATANHWVLDAIVGVMVPVLGWNIQWLLLHLIPVEDLIFRAIHIEKPAPTEPRF